MFKQRNSSLSKGSHDRDSVCISDYYRFLQFHHNSIISFSLSFEDRSMTFPNTWNFVKNAPLLVVIKHSLSCLIYYLQNTYMHCFTTIQFHLIVNSRDVFCLGVCWPFVLVSISVQLASTNENIHAVSLTNQEQR